MKKNIFKIILLFLLSNLVFAEYSIENNKIYYKEGKFQKKIVEKRKYDENGMYKTTEIPDIKTFKILNGKFAIDKDNVYYKNYNIVGADTKSFESFNDELGKDKNYFYLYGDEIRDEKGNRVNSKDYELIGENGNYSYLKDKNHIYSLSSYLEKLEEVDTESFEVLGKKIARDKNYVYYYGSHKIGNVDRNSVEYLGGGLIKDKNGIYGNVIVLDFSKSDKNFYKIKKYENIDKNSVEIVDNNGIYIKDKNGVYFFYDSSEYKKIENSDTQTFEIIDEFFVRDKNNLYYKLNKIENINKDSLETLYIGKANNVPYVIFFKTKDGVYKLIQENPLFDNSKIEIKKLSVDVENVEILSRQYYKDKNYIYCNDKILEKADMKSFEVVGNEDIEMREMFSSLLEIFGIAEKIGNITAKDKNNYYNQCEIVKN